jgi:hypothetical protein
VFTDLVIEVHGLLSPSCSPTTPDLAPVTKQQQNPLATIKAHKLVVSQHSRYLYKMLTSGMKEGGENTIRLLTDYPQSLQKLLQSFYNHVLEIGSAEELIEMLYLADEFDVPDVMAALQQPFSTAFFSPVNNGTSANASQPRTQGPSLEITLENASLFLKCSAKLGLNLEPRIFAGLAQKWWKFGPIPDEDGDCFQYALHRHNCELLLESLAFTE